MSDGEGSSVPVFGAGVTMFVLGELGVFRPWGTLDFGDLSPCLRPLERFLRGEEWDGLAWALAEAALVVGLPDPPDCEWADALES